VNPTVVLRDDARAIWQAGMDAVDSSRLVRSAVRRTSDSLDICDHRIPLAGLGRVAVVGAGKAGARMAAAVEDAVGEDILEEKLFGWINVPADCVESLRKIHLHAARPPGLNEPTETGVEGSLKILKIISELGLDDLCLVLLSGGGSALLPAPISEITLEDKQTVTRLLMQRAATINELNCVRKRLSLIKGGNLARAAKAGTVLALIISDVVHDPLDTIASGPTVADPSTAADALAVLHKYATNLDDTPKSVLDYLISKARNPEPDLPIPRNVHNYIIGNNAVALNAAASKARKLGYPVHSLGSDNQGEAHEVGRTLAEMCVATRDRGDPISPPACLLSGGEPVVHLTETDELRKGGRNQEVVLAGLERLWDAGMHGIVLLSGGTDGEDGPTDAAGAFVDQQVLETARSRCLTPDSYLAINNSYEFFDLTNGLLKTGPTHTNVMDLRVALIDTE